MRGGEAERFTCGLCSKSYKYKSGLYKHHKTCKISSVLSKEEFAQLKKTMIEAIAESAPIVPATAPVSQTIINNNVQVNMVNFLNANCADAMNITDFIDSIRIQLTDLQKMSRDGFAGSAVDVLSRRISEMALCERPVHCTDRRRNVLFIKERDIWTEDKKKELMARAVARLNRRYGEEVIAYQDSAPPGHFDDERRFKEKNDMMINFSRFAYDGEKEKMIKHVMRSVCDNAFVPRGDLITALEDAGAGGADFA